jgi:hypothetical protein
VHVRLLAAIHRLVLTGALRSWLSSIRTLGGSADPSGAWLVFEPVLAQHVEELREALHVPPQTNEVGRSAALLVGLFHAVRRTELSNVRLLEPGSSAGLNLLVDGFYFAAGAPETGPSGRRTRRCGSGTRCSARSGRSTFRSSSGAAATCRRWTRAAWKINCGSYRSSGRISWTDIRGCMRRWRSWRSTQCR